MKKNKTKLSRKNKIINLIITLLFVGGVIVFVYPFASNILVKHGQTKVITEHIQNTEKTTSDENKKEMQKALDYNNSLNGDPVKDPFVVGSGTALPDNYNSVLNTDGNGIMATLEIPDIDVLLPIYHGTSDDVLAKGAGHIPSSSLPIGSSTGNSVIIGHTGLPSAELFTDLDKLKKGNIVYINVLDKKLAYKVSKTEIVEPDKLNGIQTHYGKDLVTLITCTPYGINSHRLVVTCERTDYAKAVSENPPKTEQLMKSSDRQLVIMIALFCGVIICTIVVLIVVFKRRNRVSAERTDKNDGE